jgi:hypothetical protein
MSTEVHVISTYQVFTDKEINVSEIIFGKIRQGEKDLDEDPNYRYCYCSCYIQEPRIRDLVHAPGYSIHEVNLAAVKSHFAHIGYECIPGYLTKGPIHVIPDQGPRTFTQEEFSKYQYYRGIFVVKFK